MSQGSEVVSRPCLDTIDIPLGKRVRLRRLLYGRGLKNGTLLVLPIDQGLEHGQLIFSRIHPLSLQISNGDWLWRATITPLPVIMV